MSVCIIAFFVSDINISGCGIFYPTDDYNLNFKLKEFLVADASKAMKM
jgi:hypothetical protein